jgi:hypothetical protein
VSTADTPELPADLAELAHVAAAADAAMDQVQLLPGQAPPPPPPDRAAEVAAMVSLLVRAAEPVAPFLPDCYTDAWCEQFGQALAAVAEKRGWNLDVSSPEIALAVVTVPATFKAITLGRAYYAAKAEQARTRAAPQQQRQQPERPPQVWTDPGAGQQSRPHAGDRLMPSGS